MAIHKGLPGFETAPETEQKKQLQRIFREVFSTEQGKIVFNILLDEQKRILDFIEYHTQQSNYS